MSNVRSIHPSMQRHFDNWLRNEIEIELRTELIRVLTFYNNKETTKKNVDDSLRDKLNSTTFPVLPKRFEGLQPGELFQPKGIISNPRFYGKSNNLVFDMVSYEQILLRIKVKFFRSNRLYDKLVEGVIV